MPIIVRHDGSPIMAGLDAAAGAAANGIAGQAQGMGGLSDMLMRLAQAQIADQASQRQFDRSVQMANLEDKMIRGRSQEGFDRARKAEEEDRNKLRDQEMQDAAQLAMAYGERYGTMPPPGLLNRQDVQNWVSIMESDRNKEEKQAETERLYGRSTALGNWYLRASGLGGNGAGALGFAGGGTGGVGGVGGGAMPGVGTVRSPGGGVAGFVHKGMSGGIDGTGGYSAAAGSDPNENRGGGLPPGYGVFQPGMAPGENPSPQPAGLPPMDLPPSGVPVDVAKSLVDDLRVREHNAAMERIAEQRAIASQAIARARASGAKLSPEDEDLATTYLEGITNATLSPEQDARARVWLKSKGLLAADNMIVGPSPEVVAQQKQAEKELERMRDLLKSFDQKSSRAAHNYAVEHGLMSPSKENGQPKPDETKARAHLQKAIEDQKKVVDEATKRLGRGQDPSKALTKEDFNLLYDAVIPGGGTK